MYKLIGLSPSRQRRGVRCCCTAFLRFGTSVLYALLVLISTSLLAATNTNVLSFEQANKLYEQGKYAEAAAAYEGMIASGQASSAVFYNLGNAFFKDGQLGKAIYNYRRAEWLNPRDPDLQANLQFARKAATGTVPDEVNYWEQFIGKLTLNEWTFLTALAWWAWITLLAVVLWAPRYRTTLRNHTFSTLALAALLTLFTWSASRERLHHNPAVVIAKEAVVRYGPLPESRSFYTLHDGAELYVLDKKGDWLQVSDSAQRLGWLRHEQVLLLNAPLPVSPTNATSVPKPSEPIPAQVSSR